jgi:hypothetical protein
LASKPGQTMLASKLMAMNKPMKSARIRAIIESQSNSRD